MGWDDTINGGSVQGKYPHGEGGLGAFFLLVVTAAPGMWVFPLPRKMHSCCVKM